MGSLLMDDVFKESKMTEKEFLLEVAIWLYSKEKLTLGQGSKFSGLPQFIFQKELGKREIPIHYDIEDLHEDLTNLGIPYS